MSQNIKIFSTKKKRKKICCDNPKNLYIKPNFYLRILMTTIVQTNPQESKKQTILQTIMAIMTTLIGLSATVWTIQNWINSSSQADMSKTQTQILENQNKLLNEISEFQKATQLQEKKIMVKESIYDFERSINIDPIAWAVYQKLNTNQNIDNKSNLDWFIAQLNTLWNYLCDWTLNTFDIKTSFQKDYSKICASEIISNYSGSSGVGAICKVLYPNINWISKFSCK